MVTKMRGTLSGPNLPHLKYGPAVTYSIEDLLDPTEPVCICGE
jgi:hypothetical protein